MPYWPRLKPDERHTRLGFTVQLKTRLTKALLLGLAFMAIAAPGGGGGGGFSGGFHGGYHGSTYGRYGSGGGETPASLPVVLGIVAVCLSLPIGVIIWCAKRRYNLYEVVVVTQNGADVAAKLDDIVKRTNFEMPYSRTHAFKSIARLALKEQTHARASLFLAGEKHPLDDLERSYRRRMRELHLNDSLGDTPLRTNEACVIGILCTLDARMKVKGDPQKILRALCNPYFQLYGGYLYYAREPRQPLSHDQAVAMMNGLEPLDRDTSGVVSNHSAIR